MSNVKRVLFACALLLSGSLSFAQSGVIWNAETTTEGVTLTNFSRSTVSPCVGSYNWRTTQFRSGVTNTWRSPQVTLGSPSLASIYFRYKVVVASGTGTWTISVDLYNSGSLVASLGTITGTASTSGSACQFGDKWLYLDPPLTVPVEVRITVTTTNSTVSSSNYVQIDDVFSYFNSLASVQEGDDGLTQPSYTTGTRNISTSGSNKSGDVYVTKSTQSATDCPGVSDPDAPLPICKYTSVNGIHEVKIVNKTTGDVTYGTVESFTIPYQTATYEKAYTSVQFEDATSYYVHYFTIPTVTASGTELYWKTYEVAQP
ncbi:MAG TPA: hypothetical protein VJ720_11355 [Chitinophaga sp.]|nr:hypothetical protein [Chitinophaga sp.]